MFLSRKIMLTWSGLFLFGLVICLLLIIKSEKYIYGWLWGLVPNIIFLLSTLYFFNQKKLFKSENKKSLVILFFVFKMYINVFAIGGLIVLLLYVNYWSGTNWSLAYQAPISIFSFLIVIVLPMIAILMATLIKRKAKKC
ncbi:hypothetical protein ACW95P_03885 [Candidatus Mycoplasma pogonae]